MLEMSIYFIRAGREEMSLEYAHGLTSWKTAENQDCKEAKEILPTEKKRKASGEKASKAQKKGKSAGPQQDESTGSSICRQHLIQLLTISIWREVLTNKLPNPKQD